MAIIRKGDKKAKNELVMRSKKERQNRETKTTPKERDESGRVNRGLIDPNTVVGPVSGLSSGNYKRYEGNGNRKRIGVSSGVVKAGKVAKGERIAKKVAVVQRKSKKKAIGK